MIMSQLNNKISHTIYQTVEKEIGFLTNIYTSTIVLRGF